MIGYTYNTEQEVQQAINLINQTLGIPISIDAVTRSYAKYENINNIYFIQYDETIGTILGDPKEVDTGNIFFNYLGFDSNVLIGVKYIFSTNILTCFKSDNVSKSNNLNDINNNTTLLNLKNYLLNNYQNIDSFIFYRHYQLCVINLNTILYIKDLSSTDKEIFDLAGQRCSLYINE